MTEPLKSYQTWWASLTPTIRASYASKPLWHYQQYVAWWRNRYSGATATGPIVDPVNRNVIMQVQPPPYDPYYQPPDPTMPDYQNTGMNTTTPATTPSPPATQPAPPPSTPSMMPSLFSSALPIIVIAGGGYLIYKMVSGKSGAKAA